MYIATFYSHFGAIRFKKELAKKEINATLSPVPRNLSSSCGTCVCWEGILVEEYPEEVEQAVKVTDDGYEVLYRAENS